MDFRPLVPLREALAMVGYMGKKIISNSLFSGISIPLYLAVPGYDQCVNSTLLGGGNYQCLPSAKPALCDSTAWALLVEGDPGYPPLLPSCGDASGSASGSSASEPDDHVTQDDASAVLNAGA
jgi:hypothetical protein